MRCSACGHTNRPDRRFCAECGHRLGERCSACGTQNEPGEKFCGTCGVTLAPADAPVRVDAASLPAGERRQLTVLFSDLVGSTALSQQLDPEEWRELVTNSHEAAGDAVRRFGGHVAKQLGDGLLVYFGWPEARGDDAERAVRAGLAICDAVAALDERLVRSSGGQLAVRVGMHTGPVVIADGGEVFGDTPNIAARVQAAAEPGTVVVTATTHALVSGLFQVEDRGTPSLKGIALPVGLYRVVRPTGVRGRLAAAAAAGMLTPFVGRENERRLLRARFEQACDGEGQVVLLVGEPGIGKSRLAQVLHEDLAGTPHSWIESGGAPYFTNTPFYAVSELLRQFSGQGADTAAATRIETLVRALEAAGLQPREALPLVAPLLDLPVPDAYPPAAAPPEVVRRRLLATLVAWVFGAARLQPTVILLEDLHWVDASTLEFHRVLVEQGATAPLLLLYTARPEFRAPWPLRAHHMQLTLNRLGQRPTRDMVAHVAAHVALPPGMVDAVVSRTDGVPLFIEELTKAALEAGARGVQEIPATLADSLMARLDRLGPAKEVAQVAAVLGREFSWALLRAVHPGHEAELAAALDTLADAELVYVQGLVPEATYVFKHALVQDTAYHALLKSRRRELHRRVARVMAETFPALAEAQPELLAHHLTEGGEPAAALDAWHRASQRALQRGAAREAEASLRRALPVLDTLPADGAREEWEFRLNLALAQAFMVTKSYGAPELAAALDRAHAVSERVGDPTGTLLVLMGTFASTISRSGPEAARPLSDRILIMAEGSGLTAMQVWAHSTQCNVHFYAAEFADAEKHAERALALYDEATAWAVPADPRVVVLGFAAHTAWACGKVDRARDLTRQAVAWASHTDRPVDAIWAEYQAASHGILARDPEWVRASSERVLALCAKEPHPQFEAMTAMSLGWAIARQGRSSEGIAMLRDGLARLLPMGVRLSVEMFLGWLADVLETAGEVDDALAVLADVDPEFSQEMRADTLRRRAGLLARTGAPRQEVEATMRAALETAQRQGARSFELRTATCYAAWLREHGRAAEGRALLAPIYGWFTEGLDTPDLKDARTLLEALGR